MPPESYAWPQLRAHAAAQLSANFSDRVLRTARLTQHDSSSRAQRFFAHPFAVSAYTAALCVLLVVIVHAQTTRSENARHLADWQEVAMRTASLDPL